MGGLLTFRDIVNTILGFTSLFVRVITVGMLVVFSWGMIRFIYGTNDKGSMKKNKEFMLWSLLALFVMASLWGIIGIMCDSFLATNCVR